MNWPKHSPLRFACVCPITWICSVSCSGFVTKNVNPCSHTGASVCFFTDVSRSLLQTVNVANGSGSVSGCSRGKSVAESMYTHRTALLAVEFTNKFRSSRACVAKWIYIKSNVTFVFFILAASKSDDEEDSSYQAKRTRRSPWSTPSSVSH